MKVEPFLELAVALVARVCDSLKQLAIAPGTTDVLGWAVPLGLDQAGIKHARFGIDQAFDLDRDVVESDLEAGDGGGTYAATLRRSGSADQFHGKSSFSLWIA